MDERRYKLQAYQTVNEFKAYRQNRTEQCRLESLKNIICRDRALFEKDFKMRSSRLKLRRQKMLGPDKRTSVSAPTERIISKSLSIPGLREPIDDKRTCKSARLSTGRDCVLCDQISGLVLDYDAKSVKVRSQSGICRRSSKQALHTKELINSIETIVPLRRERTDLGLTTKSSNSVPIPNKFSTTENDVRDLDDIELSTSELTSCQKRLVREASMMVPPDENGHICSTLTSPVSRRTFPGKIEIQRKIGDFVRCQEQFNKENPVNKDVVVQCESVRLLTGSKVEKAPPKFVSRREAMIEEVLEKLGLTRDSIHTSDNYTHVSSQKPV